MEKYRRSIFLFVVVLVVTAIVLLSSQPTESEAARRLSKMQHSGFSMGKDTLDIGLLDKNGTELPIIIYNNEDTSLVVQDVVSSCGCIMLDKKKQSIPQHGSVVLKALIQRKKDDIKGLVHRTIAVRTNYKDPIKYVVVRAKVS
jgi:hypothetical protein